MLPGERTAAVCLLEGSTLVEPTGFGRSLREDGRDSKFDLTGWRCSAHLDLTRNLWMDDGRKRWMAAAGEMVRSFVGWPRLFPALSSDHDRPILAEDHSFSTTLPIIFNVCLFTQISRDCRS